MAIPDAFLRKQRLRKELRARLARYAASPAAVIDAFENWLISRPDLPTLAVYAALPGEVDLSEIIARHPDRVWLFPRVDRETLTLHPVTHPGRELVPGSFGIREPGRSLPSVPVTAADAFICPGLAFDPTGGRLGRGRGFYDRLLETARPDCVKIGICHPFQLVPTTYSEPHDIHMDLLISGSSIDIQKPRTDARGPG